MSKLSIQEEKELISFIKDWLKFHGFTQKDLANELILNRAEPPRLFLRLKNYIKKAACSILQKIL